MYNHISDICLQNRSQKTDSKIDNEIVKLTKDLYYNIDTTNLFVQNSTVQKNENVGEILNRNNIDFIQIDKIAKLAKRFLTKKC